MKRHLGLFTFVIVILAISVGLSAAAVTQSKGSLEQSFQKARKDYLQKDMKAAADEVRKGAAYLKSEAASARDKGKEALTASYQELEKLAGEMEKGTVKTVKELEIAFARAYNALATNSNVQSMEAWTKKEFRKAGEKLESSVDQLEKGFAWAGQKAEAGTQKVIDDSKALSKKMKEGSSRASAEVGKAMKDLEDEIKTFGRKISGK